jgi:hypothetical protein
MPSSCNESASVHEGDAGFFEGILDQVPLKSLTESVAAMHDVKYFHGVRQCELRFDSNAASTDIDAALAWAEQPHEAKLLDVLDPTRFGALQKLAAIRLWTGETVCYVVATILRNRNRSLETLGPILPYLRLLYGALHSLPESYIFQGNLYRAERGARENWDEKMKIGNAFAFFNPTSFSVNPQVIKKLQGYKIATNCF